MPPPKDGISEVKFIGAPMTNGPNVQNLINLTSNKYKFPFDSDSIKAFFDDKWTVFEEKYYNLAKKIHDDGKGNIYAFYGAVDGYNNFYGGFRAITDLTATPNELIDSSEGVTMILAASLAFAAFGVMGNRFKDDDNLRFKRWIAITWPYVRDAIKGGKNGFKGTRSLLAMLKYFHIETIPLNISLIGGSVALLGLINRVWMRSMIIERKQRTVLTEELGTELNILKQIRILSEQYVTQDNEEKANTKKAIQDLAKTLKRNNLKLSDESTWNNAVKDLPFFAAIRLLQMKKELAALSQSKAFSTKSYMSSAIGGLVDGLYTYLGVLVVCGTLAPIHFVPLLAVAFLLVTLNIISRIFEDYEFQYKLTLEQAEARFNMEQELLLVRLSDLRTLFKTDAEAIVDNKIPSKTKDDSLSFVNAQIKQLNEAAAALHELRRTSRFKSGLAGMKYGLALAGVLVNLLTTTAFFAALAGATLPFPLVMAVVAMGLALIILCTAIMLKLHQPNFEHKEPPKLVMLSHTIKHKLDQGNYVYVDNPLDAVATCIENVNNFSFENAAEFYQVKNAAEVLRQGVNGFAKGAKTEGYTVHHELSHNDFCSDSPLGAGLSLVNTGAAFITGATFAGVLSTRAFTQNFGKNAPKKSSVSGKGMFAQKTEEKKSTFSEEIVQDNDIDGYEPT